MPRVGHQKNHVEMALAERALRGNRGDGPELPDEPAWSKEQIEWMEASFPPMCLRPNETVEDHLRYAGVVSFIANRRARYERQDPEDDPDNMEHV